MTRRTIKSIFKRKLNDWLKNINDESLKKLILDNTIITGGAIVNLLNNEMPKDFDVYFKTKEVVLKVAQYYVNEFNKKQKKHLNKIGYKHKAFILDGAKDLEEQLEKTDNPIVGTYDDGSEKRDWGSHMLLNLTSDRVKIIIRSDGVARTDNKELDEPFEDVYDTEITGIENTETQKNFIKATENADEISEKALDKINSCKNCQIADYDNNKIQHDKSIECICSLDNSIIYKCNCDESLCDDFKEKKEYYKVLFLSSNAITLSNQVQIVIRFWGEPDEIHKNYDFVHCTCYWTSWNNHLELPGNALESIINKQLIYQGSKYPVCSIMRMRKFISRGWSINAGQILKILFQINKLNLTDIGVLEEQLVGVDSMYFLQLIEALNKKLKKEPNFDFSYNYVCSILDKLFG